MEKNDIKLSNEGKDDTINQQNRYVNSKMIVLLTLIIVGLVGYIMYIKFFQNNDSVDESSSNSPIHINYDVLNYQCKKDYCDSIDYQNIKQLLKTNDNVKNLYGGIDHKTHAVILENIANKNVYLYLVDKDKYYFKTDNYYDISFIEEKNEYDGRRNEYIYDYDYVVVHQHITKKYDNYDVNTANSRIYSFKDEKFVVELDDYYSCSYVEYENQRFYKLSGNSGGPDILYDGKFNKIINAETYGNFALDNKYIFGTIKENSKYRFFRYDLADKKYELSNMELDNSGDWNWTYNYIVKYNGEEYEIYDFDGNSIFKTNEKQYLKDIKTGEYTMPFNPKLYYSKIENKIKLMIEADICGDETCPGKFLNSFYEYDMTSKKLTHKFFINIIPDEIYQNLFNGYVKFAY